MQISRSSIIASLVAVIVGFGSTAQAQVVVTNPVEASQLATQNAAMATQIGNSGKQLLNDTIKLANQTTNLTCLASYQAWTSLGTRLVALQSQVGSAARVSADAQVTAVLNKQLGLIQSEISAVQSIQNVTNAAKGNCANQQAQTRALNEVIAQMQEQRQLELAVQLRTEQDRIAAQSMMGFNPDGTYTQYSKP